MTPLTDIDRLPVGSDGHELARFCSRCGTAAEPQPSHGLRATGGRVCESCGMGVLLRCSPDALPAPGAAFLIVTADLRVSAVSEAAEPLFGTEEQVLGRGIGDLLESPLGEDALAKGVARAAMRTSEPSTMPACGGHDGEATAMMVARISTCGPPRAALVAVAPSPFGRR